MNTSNCCNPLLWKKQAISQWMETVGKCLPHFQLFTREGILPSVAQNHHELQSTSDKLPLPIITFAVVLCDYQ